MANEAYNTNAYAIRIGSQWFGGFGGKPGQETLTKLRGGLCGAKLICGRNKAAAYIERLKKRGFDGEIVPVQGGAGSREHGMTPEFEAELRSRINPAYADVKGTESHERKRLLGEIDRLREILGDIKNYAHKTDDVLRWCDEGLKGPAPARSGPLAAVPPEQSAGLEKDAARYRWLRNYRPGLILDMLDDHEIPSEQWAADLDQAIDAKMTVAASAAPL